MKAILKRSRPMPIPRLLKRSRYAATDMQCASMELVADRSAAHAALSATLCPIQATKIFLLTLSDIA